MSQTFFSKLTLEEKISRLGLLGSSKGELTVWIKGQPNKRSFTAANFHKDLIEIVLDSKEKVYPVGTKILCSFELRGMFFFSEVIFQTSLGEHCVLQFTGDLFKSEKRNSYRLMTYPMYNINAEFDLGESYEGGKVVDLKTKSSQTAIFKNFIKMVENKEDDSQNLRLRIQDISTTGMGIHIGELESPYFEKESVFHNVIVDFGDEKIIIPEVKIVYKVEFIGSDKNMKKYKLGINFSNLPTSLDEKLGGKINRLLRENAPSKDFENLIK
jgi:hypothetical protein